MSQAEALLNSLVETTVYSTNSDSIIVIGDDRFITVPDSLKRIAVQYDHNIETVTFDCPRYWDEHDMSQMQVYINYMLPTGEPGQYLAQNVSAHGQRMTFDWTISNNVTQYKGNLSFLVCVKRTDDNGDEERHWNSELNRDLYISEGLECTQTAISKYPDIITQLLTRMDEVEAIATPEAMQAYTDTWLEENKDDILADIQNKGEEVLASIPADYTATAALAEEGARQKANAIVLETEGEMIAIDDSADVYLLGLNLYGKTTQVQTTGAQLIPYPYFNSDKALNGVTWQINADGSITATGAATSTSQLYFTNSYFEMSEGTYTISGSTSEITVRVDASDRLTGSWAKGIAISKDGAPVTFTLTAADVESYTFTVYATVDGDVGSDKTAYPMLNAGSSALPYELYSGGVASPSPECPQELTSVENITIQISNKNLFKLSGEATTHNGITFTPNSDGTITANGTATDLAFINYTVKLYKGDYILTGCYPGGHDANYFIRLVASGITLGNEYGRGFRFSMNKTDTVTVRIAVRSGITLDNAIFAPMIRVVNAETSDFEAGVDPQLLYALRTLSGIPVTSGGNYTDSNGQQWICDEIDFGRGVYVQRIREVAIDGTQTVDTDGIEVNPWRKYIWINAYPAIAEHGGLCDKLVHKRSTELIVGNSIEDAGFNMSVNHNVIYFNIGHWMSEDTVEAAITALAENPLTVKYALKNPIETPLAADEIANFKMVCSNYPNTTVQNDAGAHMTIKYAADTKTYIDNKLAELVASMNNT